MSTIAASTAHRLRAYRLVTVSDRVARVVDGSGRVIGHVARTGDGDGCRYRARRYRAAVVAARLVLAEGRVERHEAEVPIIHLIVRRLVDRSALLNGLAAVDGPGQAPSHAPWRKALARADEVERPDLRDAPRLRLPPSRDFH